MRLSNRTTIICLLYLTIVALFSSAATTHLVQAVITCTSYTPECGFFPNLKERERYIARMQALCSSNPNDVRCANFRRTFGFMSDDSSTLAREAQRAPKKQRSKRSRRSKGNNKSQKRTTRSQITLWTGRPSGWEVCASTIQRTADAVLRVRTAIVHCMTDLGEDNYEHVLCSRKSRPYHHSMK